jgi:bidirectional [NiFe] hydrogenase diaphorase subunit
MDFTTYSAPSADRRWRIVDATMRRHGHQAHALIETLHSVQESFGYLDTAALHYVAAALRVPLSRAYGVATFYHLFTAHECCQTVVTRSLWRWKRGEKP